MNLSHWVVSNFNLQELNPTDTQSTNRKVILVVYATLACLTSISAGLSYWSSYDHQVAFWVSLIFALLYLTPLGFVNSNVLLAKNILLLNFAANVFVFSVVIYPLEIFTHLYYSIATTYLFWLFPKSEKFIANTWFIIFALLFITIEINFFEITSFYKLTPEQIKVFKIQNVFTVTAIAAIITYIFSSILEKNEAVACENAFKDYLTGLNNRLYFNEMSKQQLQLAKRGNYIFSITFIDIDYFKNINDTYGHDVGDEVLKEVAKSIQKYSRDSDLVFRFGGEEFIVLMPNTSLKGTIITANKLRLAITKNLMANKQLNLTTSFGVTAYQKSDKTIEEIVKRSDTLLYQAKEKGRNRVEYILD